MKIIRSLAELATIGDRICIAIGVFDGVHRGHQAVISAALDDARAVGGTAVALTFDPHPMHILVPHKAPPLLTSTAHKLALIKSLQVPACLVLPFTRQFAQTAPAAFLAQLFESASRLQTICVGHGFRFGRNRQGDVQTILEFGRQRGVRVDVIPPVASEGETISSTAIRRAVAAGDLEKAERMLGRPYSVLGTVEPGDQFGRALGYPTANLDLHDELAPPNGVYAVRARHGAHWRNGLVNIGVRPTLTTSQNDRRVELHILDFSGDLYSEQIEVRFVKKLRDERKFESAEALQRQIRLDESAARQLLAGADGRV